MEEEGGASSLLQQLLDHARALSSAAEAAGPALVAAVAALPRVAAIERQRADELLQTAAAGGSDPAMEGRSGHMDRREDDARASLRSEVFRLAEELRDS